MPRRSDDIKTEAPRPRGGLRPDWQESAACRGYNLNGRNPWDAEPDQGHVDEEAHSYCVLCPVQRECLLAGFASDEMNRGFAYGIWGDKSPKQRRAMKRLRYRQACPACRGKLLITDAGEEWQACASCGITWRCRKGQPKAKRGTARSS